MVRLRINIFTENKSSLPNYNSFYNYDNLIKKIKICNGLSYKQYHICRINK